MEWNGVPLKEPRGHQKSYYAFELLAPNRYELDLSNEVLNIVFGQGATKISKFKVGQQKKF